MQEEEESIFIPMSDLLTGFLFIFIIMILTFMSLIHDYNTKDASVDEQPEDSTEDVVEERRDKNYLTMVEILEQLQSDLRDRGVIVEIDTENGIVRLEESLLFEKGQYEISFGGEETISIIAEQLDEILQCYTDSGNDCVDPDKGKIDVLLVEGHTDPDKISTGKVSDNWDLSVFRATETYRSLNSSHPHLATYKNSYDFPVIGVSGYAATRPVPGNQNETEEDKAKNRRIDLRFIMEAEQPELEVD